MESLKLASEYRGGSGKGVCRKLRAQGRVPAVLYGHSEEPVKISFNERDFHRVLRVRGETAIIGDSVKLYQGVTLGALSLPRDDTGALIRNRKRHPTLEDNVTIYSGATILGGDTVIGKGSVIGGNVWITESVPPYSKVTYEAHVHYSRTKAAR